MKGLEYCYNYQPSWTLYLHNSDSLEDVKQLYLEISSSKHQVTFYFFKMDRLIHQEYPLYQLLHCVQCFVHWTCLTRHDKLAKGHHLAARGHWLSLLFPPYSMRLTSMRSASVDAGQFPHMCLSHAAAHSFTYGRLPWLSVGGQRFPLLDTTDHPGKTTLWCLALPILSRMIPSRERLIVWMSL